MNSSRICLVVFFIALFSVVEGCNSYKSPTAPSVTTTGPSGATITITPTGLSPSSVTIKSGQSVTFVNNDTVMHNIVSGPVPSYSDCPAINQVSQINPGQKLETAALVTARTCAFLDLMNQNDPRFQGTIIVQ